MSSVDIWLIIAGMAAITVLTRAFFQFPGEAMRLPPRVEHALRYAPACALTALVAPEVLTQSGALALSLANPKLLGGLAAIAVMLATRRTVLTMFVGTAAYAVARALL